MYLTLAQTDQVYLVLASALFYVVVLLRRYDCDIYAHDTFPQSPLESFWLLMVHFRPTLLCGSLDTTS